MTKLLSTSRADANKINNAYNQTIKILDELEDLNNDCDPIKTRKFLIKISGLYIDAAPDVDVFEENYYHTYTVKNYGDIICITGEINISNPYCNFENILFDFKFNDSKNINTISYNDMFVDLYFDADVTLQDFSGNKNHVNIDSGTKILSILPSSYNIKNDNKLTCVFQFVKNITSPLDLYNI